VLVVEKLTRGKHSLVCDFESNNKWFQHHIKICQPLTKQEAHKMKLNSCYVLIEPLQVPAAHHFKEVKDSLEDTIEDILGIDLFEEEKSSDFNEEDGYSDGELSDNENIEDFHDDVEAKDVALKKYALSDVHKTKLF
jgi:hypothetical protein